MHIQNIINPDRLAYAINRTNSSMVDNYGFNPTAALTGLTAGIGYPLIIAASYVKDWYADAGQRERFSQLFAPNALDGTFALPPVPFTPIHIAGCDFPVEIPRSLLTDSAMLKGLVDDDKTELPATDVPNSLSLNDVLRYLPLLSEKTKFSDYSRHGLGVMLTLANYLDCPSLLEKILEQYPFPIVQDSDGCLHIPNLKHPLPHIYAVSTHQIEEVLGLCDIVPPECLGPILSFYISHYIRHQLLKTVTPDKICKSLSALPIFRRYIERIPLSLNLHFPRQLPSRTVQIDKPFVKFLANFFPQIIALNIQEAFPSYPLGGDYGTAFCFSAEEFTKAFPKLSRLNINNTAIVPSLPQKTIENLTELHVTGGSGLTIDLFTPKTLPRLERLYIEDSDDTVVHLPKCCPNLKVFYYRNHKQAIDLSFLRGSTALERLHLVQEHNQDLPPLDSFPYLQSLYLSSPAINPDILIPLHGHENIKEIILVPHLRTGATLEKPIGCPKLTLFTSV